MEERIVLLSFIFLLFLSCHNNQRISRFANGNIYSQITYYNNGDSMEYIHFYFDGTIMEKGSAKKTLDKYPCVGLSESFYPDGFPKEYCYLSSEGKNISPTKKEVLNGYEGVIDLSPVGFYDQNEQLYIMIRPFIKGINLIDLEYVVLCPDGNYRYPLKSEKEMNDYIIYSSDEEIDTISIDETIYPYYVPVTEEYMKYIENDVYELRIGAFVPKWADKDSLPEPHILLDEVIIDIRDL